MKAVQVWEVNLESAAVARVVLSFTNSIQLTGLPYPASLLTKQIGMALSKSHCNL